ncbi:MULTISPECIES: hypothetical protein [Actinomadura]|uniref:Uncharacterized protein n=1 Tax=Actinomadura yumaensis TaxID=111807 RepID=A0ABW2CS25_9ACTN|nr:hypothetical protein [Actinomadura sp. J1-007]MWK37349.1 hypothetical protein [Actinomadura sp. J1-007]
MAAREFAGDPRPRPARRLCLEADGSLSDPDEQRPVPLEELCEDVRCGRSFRAYRRRTGADCTNEVLVEVLRAVLPGQGPDAGGDGPVALVRRLVEGIADQIGLPDVGDVRERPGRRERRRP